MIQSDKLPVINQRNKDKIYMLVILIMSKFSVIKDCEKWKENIIMVRNSKDVPGLKILNSPPSERDSSYNSLESNTHKARKDVSSGKWKK